MVRLAVAISAGTCCRLRYSHAAGFGRDIYRLSGIVTARRKAIYPEVHAYNMPHMGLRNAFFWYALYMQFRMVVSSIVNTSIQPLLYDHIQHLAGANLEHAAFLYSPRNEGSIFTQ